MEFFGKKKLKDVDYFKEVLDSNNSNPLQELLNLNKEFIKHSVEQWIIKEKIQNIKIKRPIIKIKPEKDIKDLPFMGNYIYLAVNGYKYGLFKYDFKKKVYILFRHKDGPKRLILEKGQEYEITIKDLIHDANFNYKKFFDEYDFSIKNLQDFFTIFVKQDRLAESLEGKVLDYLQKVKSFLNLSKSRFITFVDTGSNRLFLYFYDKSADKFILIGYDKVSTGNPKRTNIKEHKYFYPTPNVIVDRNKLGFYTIDRRAEGTDGMGYGPKGSRIFFLGKYYINLKTKQISLVYKHGYRPLHLAFHTTTPWGLTQLGKSMSEGCIRTSRFINQLYDFYDEINKGIFVIGNLNETYIYLVDKNKKGNLILKKIDLMKMSRFSNCRISGSLTKN